MNVLTPGAQLENHLNFRKERLHIAMIGSRIEGQAIHPGADLHALGQPGHAALVVGVAGGHTNPFAALVHLEHHRHANGWCAGGGIEDVGRNHVVISLFNRSSVILRCSSAAICSSSAATLCSRCSRIERISSAVLPVAETRNV